MNNWNFKNNKNGLNAIQTDPRIDPRTYYDYLKLKDVNTKPFLMIAELIDNSISSFENYYENQKWAKKLIINIKTQFNSKNKKTINGTEIWEDTYIIFEDNAFGMDKKTLDNAVRLNRKIKSQSKMNVHGRGLKQSAFFFGIDLSVKTRSFSANNGWKIKQKLSEQKSINSPYLIEAQPIEKEKIGTEIIINNIHSDRKISDSSWKNITRALEYRYIKYFQSIDKKIEINFIFNKDSKEPKKGKFQIQKEPKISVISIIEKSKKNNLNKLFDCFQTIDDSIKKTVQRKGDILNLATVEKSKKAIKNLFHLSYKNTQEIFKFNLDLDISFSKHFLSFVFWMLPKGKSSFNGIRFFEGERAIKHAGFNTPETRPYMDWKKGWFQTGSTENRFAGSCDLSSVGLFTKTDKSNFSWSEEQKKEIDKQIYSVWTVFDTFVLYFRKEEIYTSKPIEETDINILENIVDEKFPNEDIKLISASKEFVIFEYLSIKGKAWTVKISFSYEIKPINIFDKIYSSLPNRINLKIFKNHAFWKKMDYLLKNHFLSEVAIPIALLLAVSNIDWNSPIFMNQINKSSRIFQEHSNNEE